MQIINSIICAIKGHRYPIKWYKEKHPNGEIVETGMPNTCNPCVRCGHMSKQKFYDINKMFYNICDELTKIKKQLKK